MAQFYKVWNFIGMMQFTKKKKFTNGGLLPSIFGIFLVKHLPTSVNSQEEINLGWLDFTKFGILMEFILFTMEKTNFYKVWE